MLRERRGVAHVDVRDAQLVATGGVGGSGSGSGGGGGGVAQRLERAEVVRQDAPPEVLLRGQRLRQRARQVRDHFVVRGRRNEGAVPVHRREEVRLGHRRDTPLRAARGDLRRHRARRRREERAMPTVAECAGRAQAAVEGGDLVRPVRLGHVHGHVRVREVALLVLVHAQHSCPAGMRAEVPRDHEARAPRARVGVRVGDRRVQPQRRLEVVVVLVHDAAQIRGLRVAADGAKGSRDARERKRERLRAQCEPEPRREQRVQQLRHRFVVVRRIHNAQASQVVVAVEAVDDLHHAAEQLLHVFGRRGRRGVGVRASA